MNLLLLVTAKCYGGRGIVPVQVYLIRFNQSEREGSHLHSPKYPLSGRESMTSAPTKILQFHGNNIHIQFNLSFVTQVMIDKGYGTDRNVTKIENSNNRLREKQAQ